MKRLLLIAVPLFLSLFLAACGEKAPSDGSAPAEQATKPKNADDLLIEARRLRDGTDNTPVDKAKALELFTQADSMGEPCASFFIAIMYELGETGPADNQKALEWYTKSQQNNCPADPKRTSTFIAKHKK